MIYFRSRAHALRTRKVYVCVVVLRNHTSGLAQSHFRLVGPLNRDLISGESRIVNYLRRIDSVWVYWTYLDENALQMGCLAHWPPSAFAQFGLFATTVGRLTHRPTSTFAKFIFLCHGSSGTDQSKSVQLVIRFVSRFMSLLSHDLQLVIPLDSTQGLCIYFVRYKRGR